MTYSTLYRKQEGDDDDDDDAQIKSQLILPSHYTGTASGVEFDFFILDPDDKGVLKYWEVLGYVFGAVKELGTIIGSSDVWRIKVMIMVSIQRKPQQQQIAETAHTMKERNSFSLIRPKYPSRRRKGG